jgi:hypothetical protein
MTFSGKEGIMHRHLSRNYRIISVMCWSFPTLHSGKEQGTTIDIALPLTMSVPSWPAGTSCPSPSTIHAS